MPGFSVLDIILALVLLAYLFHGFRAGLLISVGGIVGIIAGAVAAFFAIPLVGSWVVDSAWRVPAIIIAALILLIAGQSIGAGIGRRVRRGVDRTPLRIVDRILGAIVNVVVAALLMSMLAFSVASLGVPVFSQAIASSAVIRTINSLTPNPVKSMLAQLRSVVTQDALPRIIDTLGPAKAVPVPNTSTNTAALNKAAGSVVKVTGTAYKCGQNQSGSGFVVADDRVVTNAHVVAGVTNPVVEVHNGTVLQGKVVFFDPVHDLAVISVNGMTAPALQLDDNLRRGDSAAFDGYPLGGPFQSRPAAVQAVVTSRVPNIYGDDPTPLELYDLSAHVQEGNSGGPLLAADGDVVGVVFAKSASKSSVGYALTMKELAPVATKAATYSAPVAAGHCTRH